METFDLKDELTAISSFKDQVNELHGRDLDSEELAEVLLDRYYTTADNEDSIYLMYHCVKKKN